VVVSHELAASTCDTGDSSAEEALYTQRSMSATSYYKRARCATFDNNKARHDGHCGQYVVHKGAEVAQGCGRVVPRYSERILMCVA
jgi:hypothetical protein